MNQHHKNILDLIQQEEGLTTEQKIAITKSLKDAEKELEIVSFKLDRTEKIKRTTAVLLEETIQELEQKRKSVEAQNRELEIESSLERVRTVAMGMSKPDDMLDVCHIISDQLKLLQIQDIRNVQTLVINESKFEYINYQYFTQYDKNSIEQIDYRLHPVELALAEKMLSSPEAVYIKIFEGKDLQVWRDHRRATHQLPDPLLDEVDIAYYYFYSIGSGAIGFTAYSRVTDEQLLVFRRFRNVFELAYRRYRDIEQAAAQAKEAQIEAALERVRSKAMAMQSSSELSVLIAVVYAELTRLDVELDRCFILIYDEVNLGSTWWMAGHEQSKGYEGLFVKYHEHEPSLAYLNGWQERKEKWRYLLKGQVKKDWDDFIFRETDLGKLPDIAIASMKSLTEIHIAASFNNFGCLSTGTLQPLSPESFDILIRFSKVFDLTYTRFNDLQVAEAQTQKAKIETALERVRARALAMQQPEELKEVAKVLRHEMGLLGVEELETCSIYINDEQAEKAECWYALKDIRSTEKKLVNDHFALNLNDTWVGREMLQFYNSSAKQTSIVMQGSNRKEWILYCEKNSAPFRGYYGDVVPDRTYHLFKFSHGAIGAASAGDISNESWDLLQRAASVFSLAYSRFKDLTQARIDLQRLKEEKQRAEDALSELQVTQKQLIQSEKMASLGELTAGIAHEIQNPLNFVNNFSEVSTELLDEMIAELAKGNPADAIIIAEDLKQNLEKILHHGKRADGIVKGMLQHSRTSSGVKEPTNINTLADEYLRLAYHGLRAKDKFFNAVLKTEYDETIGNVEVIPQDIGRVILNLITNAFYAVEEKRKSGEEAYKPTVSLSTKSNLDKIEVSVKDNGIGISQKLMDKIFQPFFTTKPTGQGTGLGLSLSYDIIKAHGGELKVETGEGEGSEFVISLPV